MNLDGSFTCATVGTGIGVTLGYAANHLDFRVGIPSGSQTKVQVFDGSVDSSGYQSCFSAVYDGTNEETKTYTSNTRCILVREFQSGSWVTVLDASFNSFTATGFKLNVAVGNSNYPVYVKSRKD